MTRVALVEPYLGGSHRAWAEGYAAHSGSEVEVFGMPAAHWKWRMHGAHVTIAPRIDDAARARGRFDAVVASDMVNLPGLLGLCRTSLRDAAVVLYLHENQLTFPRPDHDAEDLTYAMVNWTSMLAADVVVFNSGFHRDDWFEHLPAFLRRFPDHRHTVRIDAVRARAVVVPVGIDLASIDAVPRVRRDRPLVIWNQRWEWDKGPDRFVAAVESLLGRGVDVDVAVAGDRGEAPPGLADLRAIAGDRLVHDGHLDTDRYRRLLRSADVVVSTARHEFFGVAVLEAMRAGALPVLPDGLVYPERIPADLRERCLYGTEDELVERIEWAVAHRSAARSLGSQLGASLDAYAWPGVARQLDGVVGAAMAHR